MQQLLGRYAVIMLAVASLDAAAADLNNLKGIPFLDTKVEDREYVKQILQASIMERLKSLENWPGDYAALAKHKAIAVEYDKPSPNGFVPYLYRHEYIRPHVGYWGGAWEYDTLEGARERALAQCNRNCIVILEDDKVLITDAMVDEYLKARQDYIDSLVTKFTKAEKLVLVTRDAEAPKPAKTLNVRLSAASPISVGYPDWQQDYSSACQDRVFHALFPVAENEVDRYVRELSDRENRGIYGRYERTVNTTKDFTSRGGSTDDGGRMTERMARFTKRYSFSSDPVTDKSVILEKNLSDALAGEVIQDLWVEGSVRVTHDGLPLIVDEKVSPLALRTNKAFYLGVQIRMPDDGDGCYVSKPFSNRVLDFTACAGDYACATNVTNTFLRTLKDAFQRRPLLAVEITNEEFAPGEFGMKREYQRSAVLGRPYYEFSTYTVETWVADEENPFYSLYQRQKFKGIDERRVKERQRLQLFLKVSHIFTRSVHKNGTYSEPERTQIAKFERAVKQSVTGAIQSACRSLKGTMNGTVCTVPRQN